MKRGLLDDDDDNEPKQTAKKHNVQEEDEVDPLDAFMDSLDTAAPNNAHSKAVREDLDADDHIESYIKHMRAKGVAVGSREGRVIDVDSDEEVYAAARAVDDANRRNGIFDDTGKREMDPLPPIDHSQMEYEEFGKDFYTEHEDIKALDDKQVAQLRSELQMRVFGYAVPKPCVSFAHFGFGNKLVEIISRQGFSKPTGIQQQAVPVALSGRDLIGVAQTGSGKTAAFIWPMLVHIMDQREVERGEGPIALVLAPTHELAHQIYLETKKFSRAYSGLRVAAVYGGVSKTEQVKQLKQGVEVVVATPGRLMDMVRLKATELSRVTYLVLDEADQMLNMGFEVQVRSICSHVRPDRQTLLFSATFRKRVERLTSDIVQNPVKITIGVAKTNQDIAQASVVFDKAEKKLPWLLSRLTAFCESGLVIVFVSRKQDVVELSETISSQGFPCVALHGDLMQSQRDAVMKEFKTPNSGTRILVSTDVAARGLDIKGIKNVVNYDAARDIESHVHRVGRTGRAGEKGEAYTLLTHGDDRFAAELVRLMEQEGQQVRDDLLSLAMQNPRFRHMRNGGDSHRGFRRRGRGGIGFRAASTSTNNTPLGSRIHFQQAKPS